MRGPTRRRVRRVGPAVPHGIMDQSPGGEVYRVRSAILACV